MAGRYIARGATYTILIAAAIICILPFVYMVMTSFKSYGAVINNNFWPWPPFGTEPLQWANYPQAIQAIGFDRQLGTYLLVRYFANSIVVTGAIVVGCLVTSTLAAYALAKLNLPGKNILFL